MSSLFETDYTKGKYNVNDLALMFRNIRHGSISIHDVKHIISTPEFSKRLLELSLRYPRKLYELYRYNMDLIQKYPLFIKSFIITAMGAEIRLSDEFIRNLLLKTLISPHHFISLYNPLVLTYSALNHSTLFKTTILSPLVEKLVIYEANPNTYKILLYRDVLIVIGILSYYTDIIPLLYQEFEHSWIIDYIENKNVKILDTTKIKVLESYIRVLKGLMETIRYTISSLEKIEDFETRIEECHSEKIVYEILKLYIDLIWKSSIKNLEVLKKYLIGLIGLSYDELFSTIKTILSKILVESINGEKAIYNLLTYLLETALFDETISETISGRKYSNINIEDYDVIIKYIDEINEAIISRMKERFTNPLIKINIDKEPYRTLVKRIKERINHRYLSWIEINK
ncbi:MAG: hypothetical protein J7J82_04330 [Staphylothermus sp.]|nr:hypothetical protein [Staphylothermus sp.]